MTSPTDPPTPGSDWAAWFDFAAVLEAGPGVHRPSRFSALLASAMADVAGKVVIDAGSFVRSAGLA